LYEDSGTGDKTDTQRGDINPRAHRGLSAVKGLLGCIAQSPEAGSIVSIGDPDEDVVDCVPRLPNSLDKPLSEHLDAPLWQELGPRPGGKGTLTYDRAD